MADEMAAFATPIPAPPRSTSVPRARSSRASRCPGWSSGRDRSRRTSRAPRAPISGASTATTTSTLCLGDTGAMAGHGPAPTIAAVERQMRRGITHMLPTEDAAWVGEELTRRFGVGAWQFALSASDANRWVLRLARLITGRSKVAVHDHCYHGSVDEAIAMLGPDGVGRPRPRVGRAAGRRRADDPRRRVQRHRRPRGRPRRRRRRRRPVRARPDQRRDRAARTRLPRGRPRDHPADRHAPRHRRDPHHLRRTRRRDGAVGPRARRRRHRQDDRRRHPVGGVRLQPGGRGAHRRARSRSRIRTSAASAGPSPATPCRWRPPARRSARSSRPTPSSG